MRWRDWSSVIATEQAISVAGEPMLALVERALYWPRRQALLIADLHLGKADVFRRAGLALPDGGTEYDLARLDALLAAHPTRTLWILGDLLHGPGHAAPWRQQWQDWRQRHRRLRVVAIRGNHDRALDASVFRIELAEQQVEEGPLLLRHHPDPHPTLHVVCGHLHPQVRLPGLPRRWPAFRLGATMTVLPAFSHFTAGIAPTRASAERWLACVEQHLVALPPTSTMTP